MAASFEESVVQALKNLSFAEKATISFEGNRALCDFAEKQVCQILLAQKDKTPYEQALWATYFRMCCLMRGLVKLDDTCHFQLVAMAARTIFELVLDVKALTKDPALADKFFAFASVNKYKKAEILTRFLRKHPNLSSADHQAAIQFANDPANARKQEQSCIQHWRQKNKQGNQVPNWPEHWTGKSASDRARDAGEEYEETYRSDYFLQSYYVHSGAAGILNLSREDLEKYFAISHDRIKRYFTEATTIICNAFHLFSAHPELRPAMEVALQAGACFAAEQIQKQSTSKQRP